MSRLSFVVADGSTSCIPIDAGRTLGAPPGIAASRPCRGTGRRHVLSRESFSYRDRERTRFRDLCARGGGGAPGHDGRDGPCTGGAILTGGREACGSRRRLRSRGFTVDAEYAAVPQTLPSRISQQLRTGGRVCGERRRILVFQACANSKRRPETGANAQIRRSCGSKCAFTLYDDPQPGVVQEQYPRTAMCVRNVDVHVSCSSHADAQLAAFFIDPRAK